MIPNEIVLTVGRSAASSALQDVVGMPGLKWSVQYYPRGRQNNGNYPETTMRVLGGWTQVQATIVQSNSMNQKEFMHGFAPGEEHGCEIAQPSLQQRFRPFRITWTAVFECYNPFLMISKKTEETVNVKNEINSPRTFELIDSSMSHCFNAEIVVGNDRLKVHRGFLSMLSPVFTAAFTHKTKEAETGILEIKDFDFKTVKNAIDYLYGRKINSTSAVEIVDILRFVDKYDIQPAMALLEKWLDANLSIATFAGIATYAWQYDRKELQKKCGQLYRKNVNVLALHPDFAKLEPTVMAGIVTLALASLQM